MKRLVTVSPISIECIIPMKWNIIKAYQDNIGLKYVKTTSKVQIYAIKFSKKINTCYIDVFLVDSNETINEITNVVLMTKIQSILEIYTNLIQK